MLSIVLSLSVGAPLANPADAVEHPLLIQAKGRVVMLDKTGAEQWSVPCPFVSHDLQMLPNGNLLIHPAPAVVREVTQKGELVWEYTSKPTGGYTGPVEVHGFQRLSNGRTMIAETGNLRIIEVEKDGTIAHSVPLTVEKPQWHRDTRMARKLDNGNFLVCHEGDGAVREYDPSGKVVWEYRLDLGGRERTPGHDGHGTEVYGAIRLDNGNTLIAGGNNNRVLEVNRSGKVVWSIDTKELPGIQLYWVTTLHRLPNGNTVIGNTHAGPENPYLIEVTKDKKVVWTFKAFEKYGNDLVVAQILGVDGKVIR